LHRALARLSVLIPGIVRPVAKFRARGLYPSPGSTLVYVSQGKLLTRKLDQPKVAVLAGTEKRDFALFFSLPRNTGALHAP
jgi:hypothetical protein